MLPPGQSVTKTPQCSDVSAVVLMPITAIAYGSLAAFYSQTRLATGRYMDKFDVTEKAVK